MNVTISLDESLATQLRREASAKQLSPEQTARELLSQALSKIAAHEAWREINRRRGELIGKHRNLGLTPEESQELDQLQATVDQCLEPTDRSLLAVAHLIEGPAQEQPSALGPVNSFSSALTGFCLSPTSSADWGTWWPVSSLFALRSSPLGSLLSTGMSCCPSPDRFDALGHVHQSVRKKLAKATNPGNCDPSCGPPTHSILPRLTRLAELCRLQQRCPCPNKRKHHLSPTVPQAGSRCLLTRIVVRRAVRNDSPTRGHRG